MLSLRSAKLVMLLGTMIRRTTAANGDCGDIFFIRTINRQLSSQLQYNSGRCPEVSASNALYLFIVADLFRYVLSFRI